MKMGSILVFFIVLALLTVSSAGGQSGVPVTAGLVRHYDASLIISRTTGDTVSTWPDMSSHHDATAYNNPTWQPDSINGLTAVRFDGIVNGPGNSQNEYFQLGNLSALAAGQAFIVFKRTQTPGTDNWDHSGLWRFGTDLAAHVPAPGTPPAIIYDSFGSNLRKNSIHIVGEPQWTEGVIYSAASAYGRWKNVLNGVELYSTMSNTVAFDSNALLGTSRLGTHTTFSGDIAEFLLYDRVLTEEEENTVGSYLAFRYDIATSYSISSDKAKNPDPFDGARDIYGNVVLLWQGPEYLDDCTYEVYLDTDSDFTDITSVSVSQARYHPAFELQYDADYYWRVDVVDSEGSIYSGDLWIFSTAGAICQPPLLADLTGDCRVTLEDFAILAADWLSCNRIPVDSCP